MIATHVGKRLAAAGSEYGFDLTRYVDDADPSFFRDFIHRWFALCLYRDVYKRKPLAPHKSYVGRMVLVTLPVDALVPPAFLLSRLASSPNYDKLLALSAKLFAQPDSFEYLRPKFMGLCQDEYQRTCAPAVRRRLRPLHKSLLFCADGATNTVDLLFADPDLTVNDLLTRAFDVSPVPPLVCWGYESRWEGALDEHCYTFYNAEGETIGLNTALTMNMLPKNEALAREAAALARITRLNLLVS